MNVLLLRWILFILILFIVSLLPDRTGFEILTIKRLFWITIIYLFVLSTLSVKKKKNENEARLYRLGSYACDIILGGILIAATGGMKSTFFPVIYFLMLLNSFTIKNLRICIGGIFYTIIITMTFSLFSGSTDFVLYLKETSIIILLGLFPASTLLNEKSIPKKDEELEKAHEASRKLAESSQEKDMALAEKSRRLLSLIQVARMMGVTGRLSDLLELIVTKSIDMLNTRMGFLMLVKGNELVVTYSHGISEITKKALNSRVGEGILGKAFFDKKSIRLGAKGPELQELTGTLENIRNILAVPLVSPHDNKLIGVIGVANLLTEEEFTEEHENYLKTLAIDAAISIKNRAFYETLEKSYLEMIETLAHAVEARDPYTYGHIDRVSDFSAGIARDLGLPQSEMEIIKKAAILHDLGKIGTPDHVLLKEAPLTEQERKIMNEHVLKAVNILRDITTINKEVLNIIKHHHEKYDGTGYPDGLKGNEIPIGAQIIAIADTFDAMTTDRPYRKGMSKEKALNTIQKEADKQFNSKIVSAFLSFIKRQANQGEI